MVAVQVFDLVNKITKNLLGENATLLNEDLSNTVDVGTAIFSSNNMDNYVRSLVDHIGKVVFVDRKYNGSAPSVYMDAWEFGSVLEKIQLNELPQAVENESFDLKDGESYDPNIFYQPKVAAKFFNKRITWEIPMSFTEMQVKSSFDNGTQLASFISMIQTGIENSFTVKVDGLIKRTISNMIALTLNSEYPTQTDYDKSSGVRAINLLKLYNDKFSTTTPITKEQALTNPEFARFAVFVDRVMTDRMCEMSTLYNIGGKARFTPKTDLHTVFLSDFIAAAETYLQSDTYHDDLVRLRNYETVASWQGTESGKDFNNSFNSVSTINVKASDGKTVNIDGILGIKFDRNALGVSNFNKRIKSNYNPKAEFYNNWFKMDAGYFNDTDENFIVYFIA